LSNESATERTDLAALQNLMAADRTLMAWVRTALSMISFGFTIYKLLEGFRVDGSAVHDIESPRVMGLFLTGLGTVAIFMGAIEYWYRLEALREIRPFHRWRPSLIMALIMSVTGVVLFVSISSKLV
jgi:inner membrane protein YidH